MKRAPAAARPAVAMFRRPTVRHVGTHVGTPIQSRLTECIGLPCRVQVVDPFFIFFYFFTKMTINIPQEQILREMCQQFLAEIIYSSVSSKVSKSLWIV